MVEIDVGRYVQDSDYEEEMNGGEFGLAARYLEIKAAGIALEFLLDELREPERGRVVERLMRYYPEEYREELRELAGVILKLRRVKNVK